MAENAPPAMVAASHAPDPSSTKSSFVMAIPPHNSGSQHAASPLSRTSLPENGFVRQRRSPNEDDLSFAGDAVNGGGASDAEAVPGSVGIEMSAGSQRGHESFFSVDDSRGPGRDSSPARDAWQPASSQDATSSRTLVSPFETEHAQSLGVPDPSSPLWRSGGSGNQSQNLVSLRSLASGSVDGHVHRWWASFDARVMQPFFGGPRTDAHTSPEVQLVQAEGDVAPLLAGSSTQPRQRVQVPLSRPTFPPHRT